MLTLLLAVIFLAFISLGLPDSLLGAGWPVMYRFFGVPLSAAGIVTMLISCCTIVSSLCTERLTRKLETRFVTLISVALTAAALLGFSFSKRFVGLCLWAVPYGLGAGCIDAALNNYVALHYKARDMSWLHCFWGLGAIISPYVMRYALTHAVWQRGYRIVSSIQFAIALILALTLPLWRAGNGVRERRRADAPPLGLRGALRIRGVPQLLLGFLCYCAAESTCMLWTASYLIETRGVSEARAAGFASLFFIGITVGRFLSGFVSDRAGDRAMIRAGTAVLAAGIAVVAVRSLPEWCAVAGFVVIGLGCAPIYPSIIHATPDNFGPENSQAIIGIQMAGAYVGSTLAPPLFGLLSGALGLGILPVYLAVFAAAMLLLLERTFRVTHPN